MRDALSKVHLGAKGARYLLGKARFVLRINPLNAHILLKIQPLLYYSLLALLAGVVSQCTPCFLLHSLAVASSEKPPPRRDTQLLRFLIKPTMHVRWNLVGTCPVVALIFFFT